MSGGASSTTGSSIIAGDSRGDVDRECQDLLAGGGHAVHLDTVRLHLVDDLVLGPATLPAAHAGSDFLIDGGVTASHLYGELAPK